MRCEHCGSDLVEVDNPMRREFRHRRGVVCTGPPSPEFKETAEDLNASPDVQVTVNGPESTTDRLAEIQARLKTAGPAIWGAHYDGGHPILGPHWDLRLRDGQSAILAGGYDEWRPILDLICNAPDDLAHLLAENASLRERLDTAEGQLAEILKHQADMFEYNGRLEASIQSCTSDVHQGVFDDPEDEGVDR